MHQLSLKDQSRVRMHEVPDNANLAHGVIVALRQAVRVVMLGLEC